MQFGTTWIEVRMNEELYNKWLHAVFMLLFGFVPYKGYPRSFSSEYLFEANKSPNERIHHRVHIAAVQMYMLASY